MAPRYFCLIQRADRRANSLALLLLALATGCGSDSNTPTAPARGGASAAGAASPDAALPDSLDDAPALDTGVTPAVEGVGAPPLDVAPLDPAATGGRADAPDASTAEGADASAPELGPVAPPDTTVVLDIPWDMAGIVGTGQSLAVGDPGAARNTPQGTARLTAQPFQNLKLSVESVTWPVDSNDPRLTLIPLVEPMGPNPNMYPSSWPRNIAGETAHSAMGNQITSLVKAAGGADYVSVHGEVGENGQCLSFLAKNATPVGLNGRAYEATLIETRAITRLARAAGKTYGVGAIIVTHGECDQGNANYEQQLHQLWADYDADLRAITGQAQPPLLIVSQQNSGGDRSPSTRAQWRIGSDFGSDAVCSGPKYQYPYSGDSIHMLVDGYEQLGEKYAQVYYERVILGKDWQPLQPTSVARAGRVITVNFHVPVPPLAWQDSFQAPHQSAGTEWRAGKGFEVRAGNTSVVIDSVEIVGDAVRISVASDLPANDVTVGYAVTGEPAPMAAPFAGTFRWGQLRDSDPFVGSTTQRPQPNFAVAFELPVP